MVQTLPNYSSLSTLAPPPLLLFCELGVQGFPELVFASLAHFYLQIFPLDWAMRLFAWPTFPWTGFRERGEWSAKPLKLAHIFRRVAARPL
jgi:hypothetical protein